MKCSMYSARASERSRNTCTSDACDAWCRTVALGCQSHAAYACVWHGVRGDCEAHATPQNKQELLEKCNPLGMFDSIATLAVASSMRELYRLVLVDTPLAPYFSESLSAGDNPSHMPGASRHAAGALLLRVAVRGWDPPLLVPPMCHLTCVVVA